MCILSLYQSSAERILLPLTVTPFHKLKSHVLCRPPVTMTFNVPMLSASPLRVLYLRISEKSGYPVEKWVRKVCKAGGYACRIK